MSIENRIKELLGESIDESTGTNYHKIGLHTALYVNHAADNNHGQNHSDPKTSRKELVKHAGEEYTKHIDNHISHALKHANLEIANVNDEGSEGDGKKMKEHKSSAHTHMVKAVQHLAKNGASEKDLDKVKSTFRDHMNLDYAGERAPSHEKDFNEVNTCYNGHCNAMHDAHKELNSKKTNESIEEEMNTLEEAAVGKMKIEDAIKEKHPDVSIKWEENNWKAYVKTQLVGSGQYIPSKFGTTTESVVYNSTDDIKALTEGEELSEEFIAKATTIFEAAVVTRVKQEFAKLEEEFDEKVASTSSQLHEALVEKIDGYLDYIVEKWVADNEVAIETGIKVNMMENFIEGMKGLFQESYIDVPEDKYDLLGSLEEKVDTLSTKLTESTDIIVEQRKELNAMKRDSILKEISEGLALTEAEKLKSLVDELEFESADTFSAKVKTLKESYFTKKSSKTIVESVVTDSNVLDEDVKPLVLDPAINQYVQLLNK